MIVCHSEHSFCTDFSVLELYLADSGKYSRSSGYSMHTDNLHTMCSIHTACCRNSKSSMIVWHFEHSHSLCQVTSHSRESKYILGIATICKESCSVVGELSFSFALKWYVLVVLKNYMIEKVKNSPRRKIF